MAKPTNPAQPHPLARLLGLHRWRPQQQNEAYLFLLPSLIGFAIFVVIPIVAAFVISFFRWNLLSAPEFVGIDNYVQLIARDTVFHKVLGNTVFYAVTIVPLQLAFGLLLAVALNQGIRGLEIYRLIYFMPVVTNIVAVAIVFQWLLNRDFGVANAWVWQLAEATGWPIAPPDWLNSSFWAKPAVVLLTLWKNVGFTMIIYLAGLQAVPESLYDASKVDGASGWQRFRFVTVPMVSSTTFFLLVIQMIGAFQLFAEPFVLTRGGPAQATLSIVYYIYQNAFEFSRMGKATAIAWLLFAIIFALTVIQVRLQRRWVHYETGELTVAGRPERRTPIKWGKLALHLGLILGSLLMLLPFLWMVSTSLKLPREVFTFPPVWIPSEFAWSNYTRALTAMPFGRFYLNSFFVAVSVTALTLFTSSLAAFAFARLRFRGRDTLFLIYLTTLMIPFTVLLIPNFVLVRQLGWYDSYSALIFPPAFSAFATFLLRQYFRGIPPELDDAARIDGASSLRIWWQIIMPNSAPALAALAIFIFLGNWNEFLWPLVVTNSPEMRTIPVGLSAFQGQFNVRWELLMAAAVVAMLPIIVVYMLAQKWFIKGITVTGLGGR